MGPRTILALLFGMIVVATAGAAVHCYLLLHG
jgi:hypothetical protein